MAKKKGDALAILVSMLIWIVGVLVSLAVGFGMINGTLPIMYIPDSITAFAGWVVVISTALGAILAIIYKIKNNL